MIGVVNTDCEKQVKDYVEEHKLNLVLPLSFWAILLSGWTVLVVLALKGVLVNEKTQTLRVILITVGLFLYLGGWIFGYFFYLTKHFGDCAVVADPMNKKLFSIGKFPISQWPLSHFVLYMLIASVMPKWWWLIILIGCAWEGVEMIAKKLQKGNNKKASRTRINESEYTYLTYWESTVEDIIINTVGVLVGVGLTKIIGFFRPFGLHYKKGFLSRS